MILGELKRYLADRRRASLGEMAIRFDVEPDALRQMLSHWERKGRVRCHRPELPCKKGCSACGAAPEIYEWVSGETGRNLHR